MPHRPLQSATWDEGSRPPASKHGAIIISIVVADDEPADGPQHYVVITGFYEPYLLTYLDEIGIAVDCIIQLDSELDLDRMTPAGRNSCI